MEQTNPSWSAQLRRRQLAAPVQALVRKNNPSQVAGTDAFKNKGFGALVQAARESHNSPIVCFSDSIMPVLQTGSATHFKHYSVCLLDSILYIFQTPRLENSRRAGLFFSTFRFYVRDGVVIFSQSQAQPFCALCGAAVSLRAAQRRQPKTLWSWMMPRLQARSKQAAASSSDLLAASLQGRGQVVMMPRQRGHSYPRTTPKQLCNRAVITPF